MLNSLPLFPEGASSIAGRVDALFLFAVAVSAFISLLVLALIVGFSIRYRRRAPNEIGSPLGGSVRLETIWAVIPLIIAMVMFGWGAGLFMEMQRPPRGAMQIHVVAKQWMWRLQHMGGRMEINELHVPVGREVRLTMTSEDVIHSFYVPAFRVKADVLPGRYTSLWFQPSQAGRYRLFCAQYCGTSHARMGGWVTVMEPADFEAWLAGGSAGESLEEVGARLFETSACGNCHRPQGPEDTSRAPSLVGLYGSTVRLASGATVIADDNYIRESLLNPRARITAGYEPVMPVYSGRFDELQILQLIAYIRSLGSAEAPHGAETGEPAR
jgi:cytochrome c oxidase subunit 2